MNTATARRVVPAAQPSGHVLNRDVQRLFERACEGGDLDAASDVLAMMDLWRARRVYDNELQRVADEVMLNRMRAELERLCRVRGVSPDAYLPRAAHGGR